MEDVVQAVGEDIVGAVLVVGGGIAGMQASLDLADSGYKVYLVECESAIGGHMAKLDKTFPTNDCAMCTISPRLVDVGRHLNIELLTDSEVEEVVGVPGAFSASVRTKPRYIDLDRCNGCGECAEVCPVPVKDAFNEGIGQRQAAYKLYPQATPDGYAIDKRGVAPCRDACATGQRAQGYISLIAAGRFEEAYRTIKEDNPFPAVCGRICNARCEDACTRGRVDAPIAIRALKRFVTDTVLAGPRQPLEPVARRHEERIAVIGAGPCGLTAAQDLCRAGYGVTVYEALPVAGGMLRVGVPEFRLPVEIVEREIQDILDLGVELKLSTPVNSLDELLAEGFAAVLIAVGAHEGIRLSIPGNELSGVLINTQFLRDVRLAEMGLATSPAGDLQGRRVVVLGGGDVAFDCARTALRLGASEVQIACRGSRGVWPASEHEVAAAREEGIELHIGLNYLGLIDDGAGAVGGLECERVERFEFDQNGRPVAQVVPDSRFTILAEVAIFSVGQKAGLAFIPEDAGVGITASRTIAVDGNTYATDRPGVFAAGDAVSGTTYVIQAVDGGHRAAETIRRYLCGEAVERLESTPVPVAVIPDNELESKQAQGTITPTPRVPVPTMAPETRTTNFTEIESVYSEAEARAEAERCLDCGICSECLACDFTCGVDAIVHQMVEQRRQIKVGAVVLAPGYQTYRAELSEEFGYGRYPNVITSLQHERLLSASGPTNGHVQRPSDGQTPKKIAFLQCVGSRDQKHDYCSSVCCMYAAKQAIMAKEHEPATEIRIFMMDMRSFSKGYESYYKRAREKYGIGYSRCRISGIKEQPLNNNLLLRYLDDSGSVMEEEFDLVVLSVGMEISQGVRDLGHRLGVALDDYGFCQTVRFDPLQTSRPGIYAVGPFREPKDIPDSLVEASAAAAQAGGLLVAGRHSLTRAPEFPPEREVAEEGIRTAVFVCHCGTNIAGFLDVDAVARYADTLPGVIHTEHTIYACSQDNVAQISEIVRQTGANRVVIAACSPLTHEPLFQSCLRAAGLNPYLVDMANIRNQCSWVHSRDWDRATAKAKDLVRMSAARTAALEPLVTSEMAIERAALVIGGGAAGMTATLALAEQGFPVHLVERAAELGGNLRQLYFSLGEFGVGAGLAGKGTPDSPHQLLVELETRIASNPLVTLHLASELVASTGIMGNFTSTVRHQNGASHEISHGVVLVATGGVEYRGEEYGYGSRPDIVTQQQFEASLASANVAPDSVVMIQCVGPAEQYCGRICCTSALKNALVLKQRKPEARITVIYKDIRTYGFTERLYTQAREAGILFVRYDDDHVPVVENSEQLAVRVYEPNIGRDLNFVADLLVLSTPVVPPATTHTIAAHLKVPVDMDGFFMEAHAKLRPMDFLSEGVFMAGMAHYPKLLEESIVHARAAASRAATVLARDSITVGGAVAAVDQSICVACLTCVRTCPFGAAHIEESLSGVGGIAGAATIESALCQGCGLCVAACPAGAIDLKHFTNNQIMAKVDAMFAPATHEHQPKMMA
jgi:heterodisulfide reductase subunit A-like polyferredoxin